MVYLIPVLMLMSQKFCLPKGLEIVLILLEVEYSLYLSIHTFCLEVLL